MIALAQAHDMAGHADSAIVNFERFMQATNALPIVDVEWLAGTASASR